MGVSNRLSASLIRNRLLIKKSQFIAKRIVGCLVALQNEFKFGTDIRQTG